MSPEKIAYYCPGCWAETRTGAGRCARCGEDMETVQAGRDFVAKLIAALDHPEPETRVRAALILGLRREARGVEPLLRVAGQAHDPYLVEAAIEALGRIGDPRCRPVVEVAVAGGTVRVRLAARRVLDSLGILPGGGVMNETEGRVHAVAAAPVAGGWLNRNVVGMGVTSLLSDWGHEMATAILPAFLAAIAVPAAALGAIEGVADAVSSFVKLGAGWYSDRIGRRKAICVGGYFLTGISKAIFAFAAGWPLILVGRTLGWFGRGIRGPLRDAILAESVSEEARGKAFGFHRAGDSLGAILGPLCAVGLLALLQDHAGGDPSAPFRLIFLLTLIPGVGSALAFGTMVHERRRAPNHAARLWATIRSLPSPYRRWLVGVGVFGVGDFAHTLLILAATTLLEPIYGIVTAAQMAALFYVVRNVCYAGASYPVGALSDRIGRRGILTLGYVTGALVAAGFVAAFAFSWRHPAYLLGLFCLAGIYIAAEDALEGAMTADLVPEQSRGIAYGVLGTVNGIGDLVASVLVGGLWTAISPAVAFTYAAVAMAAGALAIARVR